MTLERTRDTTAADMTDAEKTMAHAILRWWRSQSGPRSGVIASEANLTRIAEKLAGVL